MDEQNSEIQSFNQPQIQEQPITYQINPQPEKKPASGKAVASMVLGILGLLGAFSFIFSIPAVIMGIIGLILGIVANKKSHSGIAIAGIVTSSIALGIGLIEVVSCGAITALFVQGINELENFDFGPFQEYIDNLNNISNI